MKLIIQIPCLNEAKTLPATLMDLPKRIEGVEIIEYLVIDDGSTDKTVQVAKSHGVHHILSLGTNRGLATAFKLGIEHALKKNADIVVNTDADNQYFGGDIPKLIQPIISGEADLVVGCRPIASHPEFKLTKKILQFVGSWTLRRISKTDVRDAASGFRAFSKETCGKIFIHSKFSYCMETLIQAGNSGLRVCSVNIRINPKTRESRLFKSTFQYLVKSGGTMLAMFFLYRPGRFFASIANVFLLISFTIGIRYIYYAFFTSDFSGGKIQSLILLAVFAFASFSLYSLAVIGELLKANRKILEAILTKKKEEKPHDY
ncbi:glycosyltransferase family 2 protein [Desulfogranum marinum]|uniref:glycosyltransferase family 2 protein n=1 Tax=Desulfogranum marinum TaxID=453220 RepID=UPI0029C90943|nr:glycosyltransferase family 2 protein [Desulfogranum marinum]